MMRVDMTCFSKKVPCDCIFVVLAHVQFCVFTFSVVSETRAYSTSEFYILHILNVLWFAADLCWWISAGCVRIIRWFDVVLLPYLTYNRLLMMN